MLGAALVELVGVGEQQGTQRRMPSLTARRNFRAASFSSSLYSLGAFCV
jgi:hypothetical protein